MTFISKPKRLSGILDIFGVVETRHNQRRLCFGPSQHKFCTLKDYIHVHLNTNSPPFPKLSIQNEFRAIGLNTKTKHFSLVHGSSCRM